jgi:two-component system sensor histidine kinase KdpD
VQHALDWRRFWTGTIALVVGLGLASAVMLPFRSHLSVATASLVLVVPVVTAVVLGGPRVGMVAVPLGFLVFDLEFIPPYWRLSAGSDQNWLALVVYVAVVLLVGRVVSRLQDLRAESARHEADSRRVLVLSEHFASDKPVREILALVAASVRSAFDLETVALLMPSGDTNSLAIVASDGPDLGDEALRRIMPSAGTPASLTGNVVAGALLQQIPLTAAGRPVGLLVLHGRALDIHDRGLLVIYANHAALAIERAQLRDEALRAHLLEQVDEWRAALVGTVAHDLRTPLASIKVAVSDLREPGLALGAAARSDLLETIEEQTDRLTRLVSTVLDLWRLEAGALRPKRELVSVNDLVDEAAALVERSVDPSRLRRILPAGLPPLEVDPVLMAQVLANVLENAARHSPAATEILLEAASRQGPADEIEIAVSDSGQGVPPEQRELIFEMFHRGADGGRSGLGLAIAKAFVEAQGGRIGVGAARGGGARFVLTVPAASASAAAELLDEGSDRS